MEPFADAIGLWVFDLGLGVINIVDGKEELVVMLVRSATELGSPIRHDAQDRQFMLLVKWQNLIVEEIRGSYRRLGRVQFGLYGYRKVTQLLRIEGWRVNHKKIERLWREEGLQLPKRQKKRKRLYHKDTSIIRLRPHHQNHIWSIDFVHDKLSTGRPFKMLTVLDEYTREGLCVVAQSRMKANDVLEALYELLLRKGKPEYIRSDNSPEFIAAALQEWLVRVGIKPIQIYPGSPWENGFNERFNGTLRRELLNAEHFHSIKQAQVAINIWLKQHNQVRPHHALNMRAPVPETLIEKPKLLVLKNGARQPFKAWCVVLPYNRKFAIFSLRLAGRSQARLLMN